MNRSLCGTENKVFIAPKWPYIFWKVDHHLSAFRWSPKGFLQLKKKKHQPRKVVLVGDSAGAAVGSWILHELMVSAWCLQEGLKKYTDTGNY